MPVKRVSSLLPGYSHRRPDAFWLLTPKPVRDWNRRA